MMILTLLSTRGRRKEYKSRQGASFHRQEREESGKSFGLSIVIVFVSNRSGLMPSSILRPPPHMSPSTTGH